MSKMSTFKLGNCLSETEETKNVAIKLSSKTVSIWLHSIEIEIGHYYRE